MPYQFYDSRASEYDAWYDTEAGKAIFAMEVDSYGAQLFALVGCFRC